MRSYNALLFLYPAATAFLIGACGPQGSPVDEEPDPLAIEEFSGGDTTIFNSSPSAFGFAARNLKGDRKTTHFLGDSFFKSAWVTAPSSVEGRDGLGPLFNAKACTSCHSKDGRSSPYDDESTTGLALLFRLSVPGEDGSGLHPEPVYGDQFNPKSILGVDAEGTVSVEWKYTQLEYDDGEAYELREPIFNFVDLGYGPLADGYMVSPRAAPPVYGLGLLEAIADEDLLALADPDDVDGDGISGRPNYVWDPVSQEDVIGRFGLKANQPSLLVQNAGAFLGDMGLTTPINPNEGCTSAQMDCSMAITGADEHRGGVEIAMETLEQTTFYTQTLGVPARRDHDDPIVRQGRQLFRDANCSGCHTPGFTTSEVYDMPELAGQTIFPYTDLLLHDMGDGLADNRPDFLANGNEWRTPPLWGIGLVKTVNKHQFFLHDGRARGFAEAILWHGGEAAASRDKFKAMSADERAALIRFLESL